MNPTTPSNVTRSRLSQAYRHHCLRPRKTGSSSTCCAARFAFGRGALLPCSMRVPVTVAAFAAAAEVNLPLRVEYESTRRPEPTISSNSGASSDAYSCRRLAGQRNCRRTQSRRKRTPTPGAAASEHVLALLVLSSSADGLDAMLAAVQDSSTQSR